jgi:hypothetical protein
MKNNIKKDTELIIFFILILPLCSIIYPWAGVGIMLIASLYFALQNDYRTLLFFVCIILVQNITLAIGANKFNSLTTTIYSICKEAMLYGCILCVFFRKRKTTKYTMLFGIFLMILTGTFFCSSAGTYAKIVSLRQMLLPFICFFFGKELNITNNKLNKIGKLIIYSGLVIGFFGFLELFVWKDSMWNIIPLWKYQVNKGTIFQFTNGLPTNFTTYDLMPITGTICRRLVSVFVDPLLTGHYLFIGFILADTFVDKHKNIIKYILFLCSALTLSKGVILGYIFYVGLKLLKRLSYKDFKNSLGIGLVSGLCILTISYSFVMKYLPTSSTAIHFKGFIGGITEASLFGNGLGTAGSITGVLTDSSKMLTAESYIGTLNAQMGYVGLIIFIVYWGYIFIRLVRKGKLSNDKLSYNSAILLISVITESLFSESSITIVGTGLYFIFTGLCMNSKGFLQCKNMENQTYK